MHAFARAPSTLAFPAGSFGFGDKILRAGDDEHPCGDRAVPGGRRRGRGPARRARAGPGRRTRASKRPRFQGASSRPSRGRRPIDLSGVRCRWRPTSSASFASRAARSSEILKRRARRDARREVRGVPHRGPELGRDRPRSRRRLRGAKRPSLVPLLHATAYASACVSAVPARVPHQRLQEAKSRSKSADAPELVPSGSGSGAFLPSPPRSSPCSPRRRSSSSAAPPRRASSPPDAALPPRSPSRAPSRPPASSSRRPRARGLLLVLSELLALLRRPERRERLCLGAPRIARGARARRRTRAPHPAAALRRDLFANTGVLP